MVSNDDFDGKATHLNCFYLHINFEQKYPKLAIVSYKNHLNLKTFIIWDFIWKVRTPFGFTRTKVYRATRAEIVSWALALAENYILT